MVNGCIPTFDLAACHAYFKARLSLRNINSSFQPPAWMPTLHPPTTHDSYQPVAKAINRCRSSLSACPLDQLSIIILKNCPILRTLLHHIISQCWTDREVPTIWKRGISILIYKKGDSADPANFRHITLQPVWCKIFSSVYASTLHG